MLTTDDLDRALNDDRHFGWGYRTRGYFTRTFQAMVDAEVIRAANEHGWDYEDLFAWTNSKDGRWLVDVLSGLSSDINSPQAAWEIKRAVDKHVNPTTLAKARA